MRRNVHFFGPACAQKSVAGRAGSPRGELPKNASASGSLSAGFPITLPSAAPGEVGKSATSAGLRTAGGACRRSRGPHAQLRPEATGTNATEKEGRSSASSRVLGVQLCDCRNFFSFLWEHGAASIVRTKDSAGFTSMYAACSEGFDV